MEILKKAIELKELCDDTDSCSICVLCKNNGGCILGNTEPWEWDLPMQKWIEVGFSSALLHFSEGKTIKLVKCGKEYIFDGKEIPFNLNRDDFQRGKWFIERGK